MNSLSGIPKSVLIVGISSDIGRELALRFNRAGSKVAGTYRNKESLGDFPAGVALIPCDIWRDQDLEDTVRYYSEFEQKGWDLLVLSVGTLDPIGPFFDSDFNEWSRSVEINSLRQLAALHALHPLRQVGKPCHIALFAGAGTNGPAPNYSAYCVSKILLIKICELLHDENPDINAFIIGPGIVRTKIHEQTLKAGEKAGGNLQKVRKFLDTPEAGVSHDEVFDCLCWCIESGRDIVGGRNISLVGDSWRNHGKELQKKLRLHPDAFRMRRSGNDH